MLWVIYLANARPFQARFVNRLEIFNESINMISIYGFIIFSDFVRDPVVQYGHGWLHIVCLCSLLLVNIVVVLYQQYETARSTRRRKLRVAEDQKKKEEFSNLIHEADSFHEHKLHRAKC